MSSAQSLEHKLCLCVKPKFGKVCSWCEQKVLVIFTLVDYNSHHIPCLEPKAQGIICVCVCVSVKQRLGRLISFALVSPLTSAIVLCDRYLILYVDVNVMYSYEHLKCLFFFLNKQECLVAP